MSLTSCYRYVLELPSATLTAMLQAALSESDSAGIAISQTWENVPIDSYTATVTATPANTPENPSTMELTAVNLEVVLHLKMRLEVEINEIPELEKIVYQLSFDLNGEFFKETAETPAKLIIRFPAVTESSLNLVVTGGAIPLTPELIEPRIHQMYDANPSLGHNVQTNVPWPPGPDATVAVITDIYDDTPGDPGFRGAITVQVPDQTHIIIKMPGHIKIQGLDPGSPYVDTDMIIDMTVDVEHTDGAMRVKLSNVQSSDIVVNFATASIYDVAVKPILRNQIASRIQTFGDIVQTFPNNAAVSSMIVDRLVEFAANLLIPIFTPQPPASPDEIDFTNFEPITLEQKALALQLAPLEDGTVCDNPGVFTKETGFSIAIARVEANRMIQPILDNNKGDKHIEGYDMTVETLNAELHDPDGHDAAKGHIWTTGTVEVHVDCWSDPEIDFWGPLYLVPETKPDQTVAFKADAGNFDADDACCGDVDPAKIAALIEGTESTPIKLPSNFSGVGTLNLNVTEAEIFAAGIVVHGSFDITTNLALHVEAVRKTLYWFAEKAGS